MITFILYRLLALIFQQKKTNQSIIIIKNWVYLLFIILLFDLKNLLYYDISTNLLLSYLLIK
jgi:hypothetical protein